MENQKNKVYDTYVSNIYSQTFDGFDESNYKTAAEDIRKMYGRLLPAEKDARILDAACGPGHFTYALRSMGYTNVLGVDLSPQQVELALRMGLNVTIADAFEFLKSASEEYDLIISNAFLEHISTSEAMDYMSLVRKALKPGGRFICCVPNANSPFGGRLLYKDITHERSFTEYSLRQLFIASEMSPEFIGDEPIPISSIQGAARRIALYFFRGFWRLFMMAELGKEAFGVPLGYKMVGVCAKR